MNDLISIIIPMHNAEPYIEKLLDSIRIQTYKNLEIIVVNDGSQDNSLSLVEKKQQEDPRIKIITQVNSGVSKARNVGIENASGKYLSFLDADDYIEADMYEKLYHKMKEINGNILRANCFKEDINGNNKQIDSLYDLANRKIGKDEIKTTLLSYIFDNKIKAYTTLLFIKTDFVKGKFFFKENIHMMEDLLFFLDLLMAIDDIYFYDFPCYHYVLHANSNSNSRKNIIRNYKNTLTVVSNALDLLNKNHIDETIIQKVHHIYSVGITKYILNTFKEQDEYTLTFPQMVELLQLEGVTELVKDVDFSNDIEYVKIAGNYIQKQEYEKLYQYAKTLTF